jgi:hypothetical protein
MLKVFLLIVPVISFFFNVDRIGLPRIHLSMYGFIIPLLFCGMLYQVFFLKIKKYDFLNSELVFYTLVILGGMVTLSITSISYINLLKDLAKLTLFSIGIFVYRYYFSTWENYRVFVILSIIASAAIVWINPRIDDHWMYLTPFSFYIFFMYLIYNLYVPYL